MPNDAPDWTRVIQVQEVGTAPAFTPLGDTTSQALAADAGTEQLSAAQAPTSSVAAVASFKAQAGITPALVKAGSVVTGTPTAVNPAYGQATGAGNFGVCLVTAGGANPTTAAAGWAQVGVANPTGGGTRLAVWAKPNLGAAEAAPAFTSTGSVVPMQAVLIEFSGVLTAAANDQFGGLFQAGAATSITATATAVDAASGDLAVLGVDWRNGTSPFTAAFAESFNNKAVATRAADNGSSSLQDHLVASFTVVPAAVVAQPLGVAAWLYDSTGTSAPATGSQASVVLAATTGKRYIAALISASKVQTATTAGTSGFVVKDGSSGVFNRVGGVPTGAGNSLEAETSGVAIPGTAGNSMTAQFAAADTGVAQAVNLGAYLR